MLGSVRELLVCPIHLGLQGLEQLQPRAHHGRAGAGELVVPHRERRTVRVREPPGAPRRFQQGVALLQRPVVVRARGTEHRPHGRGEIVQEPPPVGGIPLDQGQVLRGEQHGVQGPQGLTGADRGRPIDPHAIGPCGIEFVLEDRALSPAVDAYPDDRLVGSRGDERSVARDTVGAQGRGPVDRLHDVGLAHTVGSHEHRESRGEREVQTGIGPEVREGQVVYEHTITGWADAPA